MDLSRLTLGERIAGASALALLIFMFLPWYAQDDSRLGQQSFSAWHAFAWIDVALLLVAGLAIAAAAARAARLVPPPLPVAPSTMVAVAGMLAALLILLRTLDLPSPTLSGVEVERRAGLYLGLLAALGVAAGGVVAMRERRSRRGSQR